MRLLLATSGVGSTPSSTFPYSEPLFALLYGANQAKWYSALKAAVMTSISGLARVADGDTVVVGIFLAIVLLLGAALVLSIMHWRDWKAKKSKQGDGLKKAKPLEGLLRDHPSQRKADDPALPHQPPGSPGKKPTAAMLHEILPIP
jgi:hypothetical protein